MSEACLISPASLPPKTAIPGGAVTVSPKKPLSVESYDTLIYALWMLNKAEDRVKLVQDALQARGVSFDVRAFERATAALDAAYAALQPAMLAHLDSLAAQKGGAS
jgi:hypothetical protein